MGASGFLAERLPNLDQVGNDDAFVGVATRLGGVAALSVEECVALLSAFQVGRIAVSVGALPMILPVNYLAFDGALWFRAPSNGTLLRASVGSVVAFEVDGYDDAGGFGWSVLVRGVADEVIDPSKLEVVESRFIEAWPLGEDADRYIVIPTTMLAGQRYVEARNLYSGPAKD